MWGRLWSLRRHTYPLRPNMPPEIRPRGSEGLVRIVNVTRGGGDAGWSSLGNVVKKLDPSGFVAIDTEFSGLGSDPLLTDTDMSVRYEALRNVVDSGAVLSLGIAVFNPRKEAGSDVSPGGGIPAAAGGKPAVQYEVATFDFCMCCETPWSVSADAGRFLVSHSFDFNRLFSSGIPYVRASTEMTDAVAKAWPDEKPRAVPQGPSTGSSGNPFIWGPMPRGLLWRIGRAAAPVVLHNGLMDLVFLYSAFHGSLPATLNLFVAALLDSVPAGFYDTKHLATTVKPERASFLSFVYAKAVQEESVHVLSSAFLPRAEIASPEDFLPSKKNGETTASVKSHATGLTSAPGLPVCILYSLRGHCPKGTRCLFSHNAFDVLAYERSNTLPDIKDARKVYKKQQKQQSRANAVEETRKRSADPGAEASSGGLEKEGKKKRLNKKARRRSVESGALADASKALQEHDAAEPRIVSEGFVPGASNVPCASLDVAKDHSAGWDAYMTGFCFAAARARVETAVLEKERNKLPLAKKSSPLLLCRSAFDELNAGALSGAARPASGTTSSILQNGVLEPK
jgi:target of EGR1 protein 1